jgi:hypothetical protein
MDYTDIAREYGLHHATVYTRLKTLNTQREDMSALVQARAMGKDSELAKKQPGAIKSISDEVEVCFSRVQSASELNAKVRERLEDYLFGLEDTPEYETSKAFFQRFFGDDYEKKILKLYGEVQQLAVKIGQFGMEMGKTLQYALSMKHTWDALFNAMASTDVEMRKKFVKELMRGDAVGSIIGRDMMKKMGMEDFLQEEKDEPLPERPPCPSDVWDVEPMR